MSRFRHADNLVGYHEIAELLSVSEATPRQWDHRGLLPDPYIKLAVGPLWWASQIIAWAKTTGRWVY